MAADAQVRLWGSLIGAVSWLEDREIGVFQYAADFLDSGVEPAPLTMPLDAFPYQFPALPRNTFKGLPGLLADALPDRFGHAVIDAWLAAEGRTAESFSPVERLCYIGRRGMGALEFEPALRRGGPSSDVVEIERLVALADRILDERAGLRGTLSGDDDRRAIETILKVGTSAGGARAKAVLAWNPRTDEFRSGQLGTETGFEPWLIKFDGVSGNRDKELNDPLGYGRIEYAYHLMARSAGIGMSDCRLHHEGGRSHFMTRRFDRDASGGKIHMQTLGAIAHLDFNRPDLYAYEQALQVIRRLDLPRRDLEQQVLRAMFNVTARNQDDHVKNIAFLMDRTGRWRLSPAYDLTYAYDPAGRWTGRHQMSLAGKRDGFVRDDLIALAETAGIKRRRALDMLDRVVESVRRWPEFAAEAGVEASRAAAIAATHRMDLPA